MCRCQHLLTQMRSTVVYWSPGTHLSLGARVGEGCKEVLTLFPRLDTHEKLSQDPSSATERRQSRFLLNCRCRVAAKAGVSGGGGRRGDGAGALESGEPAFGKLRWVGMQLVPS